MDLTARIAASARLWYNEITDTLNQPVLLNVGSVLDLIRRMCMLNEVGLGDSLLTVMQRLIVVLYVDGDGDLTFPRMHNTEKAAKIKTRFSLAEKECIGK